MVTIGVDGVGVEGVMVTHVGVRDLKAKLSAYLQEVKQGRTVVITERGRPVCRIVPAETTVEERVQSLVDSGFASWSGKRLTSGSPVAKVKAGGKTLAEIVVQNRD